jgi:hypothetical protein
MKKNHSLASTIPKQSARGNKIAIKMINIHKRVCPERTDTNSCCSGLDYLKTNMYIHKCHMSINLRRTREKRNINESYENIMLDERAM